MLLDLLVLFIALHVTTGCTLTNNKKTSKMAKNVGDTVLLPCSCSDHSIRLQRITWKKFNNSTQDWDSVSTNQDRFQLSDVQSTGNLSLLISLLTVEDDGLYRCQTGMEQYTDINLSVKDETALEPPNKAFFAVIPVGVLLLGLGGAMILRYRAKKQEQTSSRKGLTGLKNGGKEGPQREEQKTQDEVIYTTVVQNNTSPKPKAVSTEERTEYAIIKLN